MGIFLGWYDNDDEDGDDCEDGNDDIGGNTGIFFPDMHNKFKDSPLKFFFHAENFNSLDLYTQRASRNLCFPETL